MGNFYFKKNKNNMLYSNNLDIKEELSLGHKPISLKIVFKLSKSICKIIYYEKNRIIFRTGFFMIYKSLKLLISTHFIVSSDLINKNIEIIIWNGKKISIKLDKNFRYYQLFERPIDISLIEIKDSDGINQDIEYLYYDLNFLLGYYQYKGLDVISIGYPFGEELASGSGKITYIHDFEFEHNVPTEIGSAGSPIILFNTLRVIGIHKYGDLRREINVGTFVGNIVNEIDKYLKKEKNKIDKIEDSSKKLIFNENYGDKLSEKIMAKDITSQEQKLNSSIPMKNNDYYVKIEKELNLKKQKNLELTKKLNEYINMVNLLNAKINSKNIEIINLKNELNKNNLSLSITSITSLEDCKPGEKILAVHILSNDYGVNCPIACKNTNIFKKLEEKLFMIYPEYKYKNPFYTVNGKIVDRNKSIQENNIKNHDIILLNFI